MKGTAFGGNYRAALDLTTNERQLAEVAAPEVQQVESVDARIAASAHQIKGQRMAVTVETDHLAVDDGALAWEWASGGTPSPGRCRAGHR